MLMVAVGDDDATQSGGDELVIPADHQLEMVVEEGHF